jgi:LuxR family maltose regulon positive regulatory protein
MGEAGRAALGPGVSGLLNPVPAQRARLLLAQGDVAAAANWTQERGLRPDDEPGYPREREYLVLARVLLAQDRPAQALTLLERMLAAAVAQDRTGSVIEIGALRALALAGCGDRGAAVDALARALGLGCSQGYVRVFADEATPMAALLARLAAAQKAEGAAAQKAGHAAAEKAERGVPASYLAKVRQASGGQDDLQVPRRVVVPGLVEQLTARELEVLALLAAGMPNPRIAQHLVVTLDTVKKHVSHLLGKLGAANRTEAVTRARHLGLIP